MQNLKGFPYFEVEFNKEGKAHDQTQVKALTDFLAQGDTSDLFVISHGWNNDIAEARDLYTGFFDCMRQVINLRAVSGVSTRNFAIMAVLWPSQKFAEEALTAGGAASAGSPVTTNLLKQKLEELKPMFDDPKADAALDKAKKLVSKLENSPKARREFADLLRSLLPQETSTDVDAASDFFKLPGDELVKRLGKPLPVTLSKPTTGGGAAMVGGGAAATGGGAAGLGQLFGGIKWGVLNLLNFTTYYEMKERAGLIGSTGVNQVLRSIRAQKPKIKIHLIGHSFGGRLVTAAAAGPEDQPPLKVNTMTLLQAAFSHYGFAEHYDGTQDGFFRRVVTGKIVSGPTIISCTQNDIALGKLYPLASLIAGQVASAIGDKNDMYGGIGRNGAQKTPEASDGTLLKLNDPPYQFQSGALHNLNSDEIISGHSDICHNEVAYAVLNAVSMT